MTKDDQIRDGLNEWAKRFGPAPTVLATVLSVDEAAQTVHLQDDDGTEIPDVRLRPVLDGATAVYHLPKAKTWCLAVRIENEESEWMALAFGEIDKSKVKTGTASFTMTTAGFVFQNGNDTLWSGLKSIIEALEVVVIAQGTNIDRVKLAAGKLALKNVLNGT